MLILKKLSVNYQKSGKILKAVDNISLKIQKGSIVGLVGESGSGKSTIAKAIMGIVKYEGEIILNEKVIKKTDKNYYKDVQMVFQNPYGSLNPRMKIKKILEEPLLNFKIETRDNISKQIDKLIEKVGLSKDVLERTTGELSGGQLQRIAIARTIGVHPKILIADEPMSGLDMSIKAQIINLFKSLHRENKFSLLLISHDLNLIGFLSDYIYLIYKGKILERGTRDEIILGHKHPYTKLLFKSSPSTWKGKRPPENIEIMEKRNTISECPFAPICSFFSKECEGKPLEEQRLSSTHYIKCLKFN